MPIDWFGPEFGPQEVAMIVAIIGIVWYLHNQLRHPLPPKPTAQPAGPLKSPLLSPTTKHHAETSDSMPSKPSIFVTPPPSIMTPAVSISASSPLLMSDSKKSIASPSPHRLPRGSPQPPCCDLASMSCGFVDCVYVPDSIIWPTPEQCLEPMCVDQLDQDLCPIEPKTQVPAALFTSPRARSGSQTSSIAPSQVHIQPSSVLTPMAPENSASICRMKCSPSLSSFSFASGIDKTSQTSTLPTARELFAAAAASHDSLPDLALPQAVPGGVSLFHSYASHSVKGFARFGHKQINQDALLHCAHTDVNQHCGLCGCFAVMDGHGKHGHDVSRYLQRCLQNLLSNCLSTMSTQRALNKIMKHVSHCLDRSTIDLSLSGSTCSLCVIAPETPSHQSDKVAEQADLPASQRCIWTAHVGDSRAIIARSCSSPQDGHVESNSQSLMALPLTSDHKPTGAEAQRILRAGGRIAPCSSPLTENNTMRVWLKDRDLPGLAMTRSFGDVVGHKAGIIPEPQISCHHIGDNDKFLILASDGVFDVMSNQDVVDMLASHATNQTLDDIDLQCVCDAIVTEATKRFVDRDEVSDDTSIIIVRL